MPATTRNSKQREAILNFLSTRKDHPTADVVYASVKEQLPNISLGTVYRNLGLLADRGEILRLSCDGKVDHFDACTTPHYHFLCTCCGAVSDVEIPFDHTMMEKAQNHLQAKVTGCSVLYSGLCHSCLTKETQDQ